MNEESKKSLIQLIDTSKQIIERLIENGGELTDEQSKELASIEVNLPAKIDSYAIVLERLDAESDYWKTKAEEYRKISKGCDAARERIKESLKFAMREMGKDELVGKDVRFKVSNSKPKLVVDESSLDKAYFMQVTTLEVDKKRIEEDLKLGVPIAGAKLEETKSIRQYNNSKGDK